MSEPPEELCLDADVLMNLLATDSVGDILQANGLIGLVCPRTEAETLYLNPRMSGGARSAIDLEPLVVADDLRRVTLSSDEVSTFVRLASRVDDGEAQVLAIAVHRSLGIATDDRKAGSLAAKLGIRVRRTPELLSVWAAGATPAEASSAVLDIEIRASYRPRLSDPLRPAWDRIKAG